MGVYLEKFEALLNNTYSDEQFIFPLLIVTHFYITKKYEEGALPPDQFYVNLVTFRARLSVHSKMQLSALSHNFGRIIATCCLNVKDKMTGDTEKKLAVASKEMPQFPDDFQEVLDSAKKIEIKLLIEKNKRKIPPPEVTHAEIVVAGAEGNIEAIVDQIGKLQSTLNTKSNRPVEHKRKIEQSVLLWKGALPAKISALILDSVSVESLKLCVHTVFKDEMSEFKKSLLSHLDFLESQDFFIHFYEKKSASDKYDYVCAFDEDLTSKKIMRYNLNVLLRSLSEKIVEQEYKYIAAEQHRLMNLPDSTIAFVFKHLREWASTVHCLSFKRKALFKILMDRIDETQAEFEVWGKVNDQIVSKDSGLPYRTYQPLMRDVFSMRFYKHPSQNPKKLLPKSLLSSSNEDESDTDSDEEVQVSKLPMAALSLSSKK